MTDKTNSANKSKDNKTPYKYLQPKSSNSTPLQNKYKPSPFHVIQNYKVGECISQEMASSISKLLTIFIYYSSYGDKLNINCLKSSNFNRLLIDAGIIKDSNKVSYELLFSQVSRNGSLDFQQFLDSLVKISTIVYPHLAKEDAVLSLVTRELGSLYDHVDIELKGSSLGKVVDDEEIPNIVILLMMSIDSALFNIYDVYYNYEKNSGFSYEERFTKGLAATFKWILNFGICPDMLSKPMVFYIFQSIVNKEDSPLGEYIKPQYKIGKMFTFAKFVELFTKIGFNCKLSVEVASLLGTIIT